MPPSESLHGNVPDNSSAVLILIDVIGDFEFEDGENLYADALKADIRPSAEIDFDELLKTD